MFNTFRNAWKIDDLRRKILFTLFVLVVFRLGIALKVPYVDAEVMRGLVNASGGDMLSFIDYMSGGAFSSASLFALGVQPYINASIIMQLLAVAIPALDRLRKEGPAGQKKYTQITRIAGGALGLVLGGAYYLILRNNYGLEYGIGGDVFSQVFSAIVIIATFTAGGVLLMWLGEQIDQHGIGNGISILIFAGILSRWSNIFTTIGGYFEQAAAGEYMYYIYIPVILVLALAAVVFVIILNSAERRIPVQYAKKVVGRKMYGGQASHIPIKVNMSGVMPIIFASALTSIPGTIIGFVNPAPGTFWFGVGEWFNTSGYLYAAVYALLIIAFNYFYVAIQYNPIEIANNLKKNNGAIPGIRPGKPTSDFIAKTIGKVTLIGAVFLVVVAVGPIILTNVTGVQMQLGGTSLLIVVGVALDTSRSFESFMLMRHHKGFLE